MSTMDLEDIRTSLVRLYAILLAPPAAIIAGWAVYRKVVGVPAPLYPEILGPVTFVGALVLAMAIPIWVRSRFVKEVTGSMSVAPESFLTLEKGLLKVVLSSTYFAAAAYVCSVKLFHFGGAFLAALYACYYYYPTKARVAAEAKLFRVLQNGGSTT